MSKAEGEERKIVLADVVEQIINLRDTVETVQDDLSNVLDTLTSVKFEMLLSKRKREMIELFEDAADEHAKSRAKCVKMAAEL